MKIKNYVRVASGIGFYGNSMTNPGLSNIIIRQFSFDSLIKEKKFLEIAVLPFDSKKDAVVEITYSYNPLDKFRIREISKNYIGLASKLNFYLHDDQIWIKGYCDFFDNGNNKIKKVEKIFENINQRKMKIVEGKDFHDLESFICNSKELLYKYSSFPS